MPVVGLAAPSSVRLEDGSVYNGRDILYANPEAESIGAETSSRSIQENPEFVEETTPAVVAEAPVRSDLPRYNLRSRQSMKPTFQRDYYYSGNK